MANIQKRVLFLGGFIEKLEIAHGHRGVESNFAFVFRLAQQIRRLREGKCRNQHRNQQQQHESWLHLILLVARRH